MKGKKLIVKIPQRVPGTRVAQRPKVQNISRKAYKRSGAWKKEDFN